MVINELLEKIEIISGIVRNCDAGINGTLNTKLTPDFYADLKKRLLENSKSTLNNCLFVRLGDLVEELANILKISKEEISINVLPQYTLIGEYPTEDMIAYIKGIKNLRKRVDVIIAVPDRNVFFTFNYMTKYNMPQADGKSFIDHCYSEVFDDSWGIDEPISYIRINSDKASDILIKVPYRVIAFGSSEFEKDVLSSEITKGEYYRVSPLDIFVACIKRCVNKVSEIDQTLNRTKPEE